MSAPPDTTEQVCTVEGAPGRSGVATEMGGKLPPALTESARVHSYARPSTTTWPDASQVQPLPFKLAGDPVRLQGSVTATVTGPIEASPPALETTTLYCAIPPCTRPPVELVETVRSGWGASVGSPGLSSMRIASYWIGVWLECTISVFVP